MLQKQLNKFLVLAIFTISGCAADLQTKDMVNTQLKHQSVPVIENYLNFTYVENHAIAFGMFEKVPRNVRMPIIFAIPFLTTLIFMYVIWKAREQKFSLLLPIFIILGGAYGNLIDRAMNGYVTDFIHVHWHHEANFYVFNVADVLVNIGFILILLQYKQFNDMLESVFGTPEAESKDAPAT